MSKDNAVEGTKQAQRGERSVAGRQRQCWWDDGTLKREDRLFSMIEKCEYCGHILDDRGLCPNCDDPSILEDDVS